MRAGKAYISGLGTTGVLLASSLLLFIVVGTLVAFDSWPQSAAAEPPPLAISDLDDERSDLVGTGLAAAAVPAAIERAAGRAPLARPRRAAAAPRIESGAATAQAPAVSMSPAAVPPFPQGGQSPPGPGAAPAQPTARPEPPIAAAPSADLPASTVAGVLGGGDSEGGGLTEVTGGEDGTDGQTVPVPAATVPRVP